MEGDMEMTPEMKDPTRPDADTFLKLLCEQHIDTGIDNIDFAAMVDLISKMPTMVPYERVKEFFKLRDIEPGDFESFMREL